ncbi:MAG: hypothetical protein OXT01_09815, partial [Rhodospirillaceae bacterium]|nr:hypothetical protein [Rhodospirillaceae bacterium]
GASERRQPQTHRPSAKRLQFFVWPTENSDAGYSVDVDSFQGRTWFKDEVDWKAIIIEDLKKELAKS